MTLSLPSGRFRAAAVALAATLVLAGCSGSGSEAEEEPDPTEALAEAKTQLDETSGVRVELSTPQLPPGVAGVVSANGIGTHAPAFEGDIKVATSGVTADVAVVAVDGTVYAILPFTTDYAPIDPADYDAPDPAALMDPDQGLSSLLTSVEDAEEGEQVRDGSDVLTEYTGTLPGEVVANIIPTSSPDSTFDAAFTLDDDRRLVEAVITGEFYPDVDEVTYTIRFTEYDTTAEITAP